jgi:hypothetical protein
VADSGITWPSQTAAQAGLEATTSLVGLCATCVAQSEVDHQRRLTEWRQGPKPSRCPYLMLVATQICGAIAFEVVSSARASETTWMQCKIDMNHPAPLTSALVPTFICPQLPRLVGHHGDACAHAVTRIPRVVRCCCNFLSKSVCMILYVGA